MSLKSSKKTPKISMPPKQPLDSLPGPLEAHLGSPGSPRDPNWCQNGAKMHPKTGPNTPPHIKMPIVSKTHYLLCFNYILEAPRAFKICFFPSQFLPRLLWPPFGYQGDLKKHLRYHLAALLWISGPPLVPQGLPRSLQKVTKNHQKSILQPGCSHGVPQACQTAFQDLLLEVIWAHRTTQEPWVWKAFDNNS